MKEKSKIWGERVERREREIWKQNEAAEIPRSKSGDAKKIDRHFRQEVEKKPFIEGKFWRVKSQPASCLDSCRIPF